MPEQAPEAGGEEEEDGPCCARDTNSVRLHAPEDRPDGRAILGPDIVDVRVPRLADLSRRMQYRYALALDGNDVPSSIREDLLSGSCMLLPKPFFESNISFRLRADEHYAELKADLSDLEEKLNWCREHDRECREIAERGARYAAAYLNPRLEDAVRMRTVEVIRNNSVMY